MLCTTGAEKLFDQTKDDRLANGLLAGVLLVGSIMTALIKPDYRRQAAAASGQTQDKPVAL